MLAVNGQGVYLGFWVPLWPLVEQGSNYFFLLTPTAFGFGLFLFFVTMSLSVGSASQVESQIQSHFSEILQGSGCECWFCLCVSLANVLHAA